MQIISEAIVESVADIPPSIEELQKAFFEKKFTDYILNNISILIFVVNKENRFIYINDTVVRKYGYTHDQLLGMSIGDLDIHFNASEHDDSFWEMFKREKILEFHAIHRDREWNLYPVLVRDHYLEYENQAYHFGIVEDESYIQKIIDAQDGFVILTDGEKLVMANSTLLDFLNYQTLIQFMSEHKCICEFFIKEEGFIHNYFQWIEDVKDAKHKDAKVKIKNQKTDEVCIFLVRASQFDKSHYIVTFTDITELEQYKVQLEILSITDGLTSLFNRRYFNKILPREINRAKRDNQYLAFMMIDVDFFKQYNDIYGHLNGDDVLTNISYVIKKHFSRASEFCFRLGGEEFGIISTINSISDFAQQAEQLRIFIEELHIEHDGSIISSFVTISAGIVIGNESDTSESLYTKADQELYKAKNTGRNRICIY